MASQTVLTSIKEKFAAHKLTPLPAGTQPNYYFIKDMEVKLLACTMGITTKYAPSSGAANTIIPAGARWLGYFPNAVTH
jgi:hypothetical protein